MNKKWLPYILIIVLGIALLAIKQCNRDEPGKKPTTTTKAKTKTSTGGVDRNRGFDRRISYIEYTAHARCRMKCRKISQAEVEDIMQEGKINYNKSDVNATPCPIYALEGITKDDQRVRIVFAQCDYKTKVVTCIDLNTDWECDCPGDDDKYKNKR